MNSYYTESKLNEFGVVNIEIKVKIKKKASIYCTENITKTNIKDQWTRFKIIFVVIKCWHIFNIKKNIQFSESIRVSA